MEMVKSEEAFMGLSKGMDRQTNRQTPEPFHPPLGCVRGMCESERAVYRDRGMKRIAGVGSKVHEYWR